MTSKCRISSLCCSFQKFHSRCSWKRIQQTANVTDAEVNDRFRNTALCAVLQTVNKRYHVRPKEAAAVPSLEEIASRWPGIPPDEIEALYRDYIGESTRLEELGLDDEVYERVKELAAEMDA